MFKKGRQITISIAGLLLIIAGIAVTVIFLRDKLLKKLDSDEVQDKAIKKDILNQVFKSRAGQFITWGLVALASVALIVFVSYIMRFPKYHLIGTLMALVLLAGAVMLAYFANEIKKTLNNIKKQVKESNVEIDGVYDDFDNAFKGTLYTTIGLAGILGLFLLLDQNF